MKKIHEHSPEDVRKEIFDPVHLVTLKKHSLDMDEYEIMVIAQKMLH